MTISAPGGPRSVPTRDVIDWAAARLRHETAQDQYAGLRDPQVAVGLAVSAGAASYGAVGSGPRSPSTRGGSGFAPGR
jgi:hypothetical protein